MLSLRLPRPSHLCTLLLLTTAASAQQPPPTTPAQAQAAAAVLEATANYVGTVLHAPYGDQGDPDISAQELLVAVAFKLFDAGQGFSAGSAAFANALPVGNEVRELTLPHIQSAQTRLFDAAVGILDGDFDGAADALDRLDEDLQRMRLVGRFDADMERAGVSSQLQRMARALRMLGSRRPNFVVGLTHAVALGQDVPQVQTIIDELADATDAELRAMGLDRGTMMALPSALADDAVQQALADVATDPAHFMEYLAAANLHIATHHCGEEFLALADTICSECEDECEGTPDCPDLCEDTICLVDAVGLGTSGATTAGDGMDPGEIDDLEATADMLVNLNNHGTAVIIGSGLKGAAALTFKKLTSGPLKKGVLGPIVGALKKTQPMYYAKFWYQCCIDEMCYDWDTWYCLPYFEKIWRLVLDEKKTSDWVKLPPPNDHPLGWLMVDKKTKPAKIKRSAEKELKKFCDADPCLEDV